MHIFTLEHSKWAYRADFVLYGTAALALAAVLGIAAPREQMLEMSALALLGLASWTLIEYVLHRFVLHGLRPFSTWHAEHHRRPTALICSPTVVSATLIALLVFLPALLIADRWLASALTLGVLSGYLVYTITHHATHHWRPGNAWVMQRKRWHALHHSPARHPGHYGVTSGFWDRVFGTAS